MSEWSDEQLKNAMREDLRVRWKARLQEREAELDRTPSQRSIPKWAWAAALAALIAASLWLSLPTASTPTPELFATYFEPIPNALAPEVRGAGEEDRLGQALQAYTTGNYETALALFEQTEVTQQTDGYFLYRGITELALQQSEAAELSLEQVESEAFRYSAQWYVALAYLQLDQKKRCREVLLEIKAINTHPFRAQAEQLLNDL